MKKFYNHRNWVYTLIAILTSSIVLGMVPNNHCPFFREPDLIDCSWKDILLLVCVYLQVRSQDFWKGGSYV